MRALDMRTLFETLIPNSYEFEDQSTGGAVLYTASINLVGHRKPFTIELRCYGGTGSWIANLRPIPRGGFRSAAFKYSEQEALRDLAARLAPHLPRKS